MLQTSCDIHQHLCHLHSCSTQHLPLDPQPLLLSPITSHHHFLMEYLLKVMQIFRHLKAIFFHDGPRTSLSLQKATLSSSNGINKVPPSATTGNQTGPTRKSMIPPLRTALPLSFPTSMSNSETLGILMKYGLTIKSNYGAIISHEGTSLNDIDDNHFDFYPSIPRRHVIDLDDPDEFPISFPSSPNPRHRRLFVLLLVIKLFFVSVVTMLPIYVFLLASSSDHPLTKMNNSNSGQILFIVVVCHKYSFSFLFLLRHSFYSSDYVSPYGIPSSYHMHMYSSLPSYVPIISLSS